jgi:hypothetical protein
MQGVIARGEAIARSSESPASRAWARVSAGRWPLYGVYLGAAWIITRIYWQITMPLDVATLEGFAAGTAEAPFAYRVLMPWALRGLSVLNGTNDLVLADVGLRIVVLFGLMVLLRRWMRHFVHPVLADASPLLLGVLLLGTFDWYWPYDFSTVLFWTACLVALVERRYRLYLVLLVIGAFNRETVAFLIGVFAATQWQSLGPRRTLLWSAGQCAALAAVFVGLRLAIRPPGGELIEIHLLDNLQFLIGGNCVGVFENWMLLLSSLGFVWMLAPWHWGRKSVFLRRACWTLPAVALANLVAGRLAEPRIWNDWMPIALALAGQSLMEFAREERRG